MAPSQEVASLVRLAGVSPRSTLVLAAADLLMEDAGLEPSAIEQVVISRGPGSFTGIRAGIATAQGLAAATGAEILAFDSLLVQAARCGPDDRVWAAQPGRRGEVYAQAVSRSGRRTSQTPCRDRDRGDCVARPSAAPGSPRNPSTWAKAIELQRREAPQRRSSFSPRMGARPNRWNRSTSRVRRSTGERRRDRGPTSQYASRSPRRCTSIGSGRGRVL